ncbi:inner membrane CreD family protein, partial [Campylobacter coli]
FGFLIGLIACFRGFEVKNTTQSIGIYTTKSVVNAIFWVIAFDSFLVLFLCELASKKNVILLQYAILGASLIVFYLMLLSFSERIG